MSVVTGCTQADQVTTSDRSGYSASNNAISASQASKHIGESKTVCGKVVDSKYSTKSRGAPTFLNFDRPYPSHPFLVVIWGNDRSNFPSSPERYYLNKEVCVSGLIDSYKGKPQIEAKNKAQVVVK